MPPTVDPTREPVPPAGPRRPRVVRGALELLARRGRVVEKEILGLPHLVGPGAVCLDVGAEFGLYTHVLADLAGPAGAVHAFEPQAGAHRLLRAGARAAGLHWVHPHRTALGAHSATATLSVPRRAGLPVHGRAFVTAGAVDEGPNREFAGRRYERVELTTLDSAVARLGLDAVTLVKADVEGAEVALLDGATRTLRVHRPHLLLEVEDRHTAKFGVTASEVFDRLTTGLGYTARVWDGRWREVDGIDPAERNYLFGP